MVLKFIDVREPREMRFPPSLTCPHTHMDTIELGPVELRAIEWMELAGDWATYLVPVGKFPVEVREGRTRITGYRNKAS